MGSRKRLQPGRCLAVSTSGAGRPLSAPAHAFLVTTQSFNPRGGGGSSHVILLDSTAQGDQGIFMLPPLRSPSTAAVLRPHSAHVDNLTVPHSFRPRLSLQVCLKAFGPASKPRHYLYALAPPPWLRPHLLALSLFPRSAQSCSLGPDFTL